MRYTAEETSIRCLLLLNELYALLLSHAPLQTFHYGDKEIDILLQKTLGFGAEPMDNIEGQKALPTDARDFGPGLEQIVVREWADEKELGLDAEEEGLPPARSEMLRNFCQSKHDSP